MGVLGISTFKITGIIFGIDLTNHYIFSLQKCFGDGIFLLIFFSNVLYFQTMKKFSKYFGGIYMPYWYGAFVVVIALMLLSYINVASVDKFVLKTFDANGNLLKEETITKKDLERIDTPLPISKAFHPIKKF